MTDDDRRAFSDRIKQAVAAAAARGLHAWGYEVRNGVLCLWTRPADRKRKAQPPAEPAPKATRRGIAASAPQGSLL